MCCLGKTSAIIPVLPPILRELLTQALKVWIEMCNNFCDELIDFCLHQ